MPCRHADSPTSRLPSLAKTKMVIVNRDWTDLNGNRTSGKFVRVYDRVVLIMRGLRTVDLPFDMLSREDQDYVNQILTERGERPLIPIVPAPGEGLNAGDLPVPRPAPAASSAEAASGDQGPAAQPGTSQFFQELRRRQEESRQEQAEHAAEAATTEAAQPPAENATEQPQPIAEAALEATSPPAAAIGSSHRRESQPTHGTRDRYRCQNTGGTASRLARRPGGDGIVRGCGRRSCTSRRRSLPATVPGEIEITPDDMLALLRIGLLSPALPPV